jgi:pyruvate,orthophosphate dikinase
MTRELGLPVPPGFTISTEACRAYLTGGWPAGLDEEIREHLARVETQVGRRFGDLENPLLVSVRSGAPVSMPGMMDTILNLGLNDRATAGLAAASGDPEFAEACRTRFVSTYRDIVGVDTVPDDPWEQLRAAVEAVFRSWNGDRARSYRAREGISDELGTGVTVQAMVFGNLGGDSATGVVFTRSPATGEKTMYGDVMFDAQGEDVVAGTHQTEPIAVLDERMPALAAELKRYADILERHYADVCDIEFTVEQGRLWMLQTRIGKRSPQAALRIAVEMAEDEGFPLTRADAVRRVARHLADPPTRADRHDDDAPPLTAGLGASPGRATGEIALTPDAAVAAAEAGAPVILVRRETSPDDVHGMARAVGILTSTGGLASHAAVVARGWGIPAVVGAAGMRIESDVVRVGHAAFRAGDVLTIDGDTGDVFAGRVGGTVQIVPEAAKLLSWADELRIDIPGRDEEERTMKEREEAPGEGRPTVETVIRVMAIKGFVTPDGLAESLMTTPDGVSDLLSRMTADGIAEMAGPMFRLSGDGKALAGELTAADREAWGVDHATAALDGFLPIDQRMKVIVTAWQMREVDGEPVMNDHSDPEYDAGVLADFAALHADAAAWLATLVDGLPRLGGYLARLERAADEVAEGDHAYIASPRIDSYHNVWFELHEDLILLAGRTREDEVAAGRA